MLQKLSRILIVGLVALVATTGCNLTKKDATDVLSAMQQHLAQLTSLHYQANLSVTGLLPVAVPTAQPVEQAMTMKVTGSTSFENPLEPMSESTMTLVMDAPQGSQTVTINNRRINDEQFVNFVDDPSNPLPGAEQFADVWFNVPTSDPLMQDNDNETKDDLTEEEIEQIRTAFSEAQLFTLTEDLGTEKINGVKAYHYQIDINQEAALSFLQRINQITGQSMSAQEQANFEQMIRQLGEGVVDVWISVKGEQLLQVSFDQIQFVDAATQSQSTVSGTITLSEHNQPVSIERPENAQPLLNMLAPGGQQMNAGDAQIPTEEELNKLLNQFDEFEQLDDEQQQQQINQLLEQLQGQGATN